MAPSIEDNACAQADWYMQRKGFGNIRPVQIIKVDDDYCWYFYYELLAEAGELELEVYYDDELQPHVRVTTFTPDTERARREQSAARVDVDGNRQELPAGTRDARR